jgi:hypothetical protein
MVKSIVTYLFLVGIPLAGLLWILNGDDLHASVVEPNGTCTSVELEGSFDATSERFVGQATGIGCDACHGVAFQD